MRATFFFSRPLRHLRESHPPPLWSAVPFWVRGGRSRSPTSSGGMQGAKKEKMKERTQFRPRQLQLRRRPRIASHLEIPHAFMRASEIHRAFPILRRINALAPELLIAQRSRGLQPQPERRYFHAPSHRLDSQEARRWLGGHLLAATPVEH